ncbi:MAG: SAM-dependent methyltransferase [Verrucomicrobiota bacterium]
MPTRASTADPDSTDLIGRIYQRIATSESNSITVAEFMRMALYDLEAGYYASGRAKIGREGDFFTSVSVGECFGMLVARWIAGVMNELTVDGGSALEIVELGAFDGQLANDVLRWLPEFVEPPIWEEIRYTIVEPFAPLRGRQEETLESYGERVRWVEDLAAIRSGPIRGVMLANELLDAMPVRQFIRNDSGWMERMASGDAENGLRLSEVEADQNIGLPESAAVGSVMERIEGLDAFFRDASAAVKEGRVLFFDYGFVEEEKPVESKRAETLRAYFAHEYLDNILERPGEADLTASVDFSHVANCADAAGFRCRPLTDQHRFLTEAAKPWLQELESRGEIDDASAKLLRQFQTLTHPGDMGRKFRVFEAER